MINTAAPATSHTVMIDHAVWRPFNEWVSALGIQLVRIPSGPSQRPRYSMTPRSANAAAERNKAGDLTARELQVLSGMSNGMTNNEIGKELFLSEDTVKTHARRLFAKLGAKDRAGAVAIGFRRGYIQ